MKKRNLFSAEIERFHRGIEDYPQRMPLHLFSQPPQGKLQERFAVYGSGYSVRSRGAMEEMYELLPKIMGEANWNDWGSRYCRAFPSNSTNLSNLGLRFPIFLREESAPNEWIEIADFERRISISFHSFDAPCFTDFHTLDDHSTLSFQPSTFLFESDSQIAKAWSLREEAKVSLDSGTEYSFIYRETDWSVQVLTLTPEEFLFLGLLRAGVSLGRALEQSGIGLEGLQQWFRFFYEKKLLRALSEQQEI